MSTVGILLVHGIGEQKRFEHLEGEARHIVRCLQNDPNVKSANVIVRTSPTSAYHAEQITWRCDGEAPVRIEIEKKNGDEQAIELREVWWADCDERNTFLSQMSFWLWGLSQWAVERYDDNAKHKITDLDKMEQQGPHWTERSFKERFIIRSKLFFISFFFSLVLSSLSLVNFVTSRLLKGRIPGPDIISSYIGDVKLITQKIREGKGPLTDIDLPPRVSVRRRMVTAMVDMAMADYDRWYVVAHSLGTVVAQNGLMETDISLPNYLDRDKWDKCRNHVIKDRDGNELGRLGDIHEEKSAAGKKMWPGRPSWLNDNEVIFRDRLFARLDGFLTYGSPLDKFSALWPKIVVSNPEAAFSEKFEWVNVFDETDPVAGALNEHGVPPVVVEPGLQKPAPVNYAFSGYPFLLLSHLHYLDFKKDDESRLVNRLCLWAMEGGEFPKPAQDDPKWHSEKARIKRTISRLVQWGLVAIVLSMAVGWILNKIGWAEGCGWSDWFWDGVCFALIVTTLFTLLRVCKVHKLVGAIASKLG